MSVNGRCEQNRRCGTRGASATICALDMNSQREPHSRRTHARFLKAGTPLPSIGPAFKSGSIPVISFVAAGLASLRFAGGDGTCNKGRGREASVALSEGALSLTASEPASCVYSLQLTMRGCLGSFCADGGVCECEIGFSGMERTRTSHESANLIGTLGDSISCVINSIAYLADPTTMPGGTNQSTVAANLQALQLV